MPFLKEKMKQIAINIIETKLDTHASTQTYTRARTRDQFHMRSSHEQQFLKQSYIISGLVT